MNRRVINPEKNALVKFLTNKLLIFSISSGMPKPFSIGLYDSIKSSDWDCFSMSFKSDNLMFAPSTNPFDFFNDTELI